MHKILRKCIRVPKNLVPYSGEIISGPSTEQKSLSIPFNFTVGLCTSTVRTTLDEFRETVVRSKANEVKIYGQPTSETHPHLLKPGEFMPGLTLDEFRSRRNRFVQKILTNSNAKQHCVLIPSSKKKYMSGKIPYVFRQNTDFLYLTGCLEPESCLLLEINDEKCLSTMFLRPKDKKMEMWDGVVTGLGEPEFFGVEQAIDIADLTNYLEL